MSIWLEIHCDARLDAQAHEYRAECFAHNGQQPGAMAISASSVPAALRGLSRETIRAGWTLVAGKWTCPRCRKIKESAP